MDIVREEYKNNNRTLDLFKKIYVNIDAVSYDSTRDVTVVHLIYVLLDNMIWCNNSTIFVTTSGNRYKPIDQVLKSKYVRNLLLEFEGNLTNHLTIYHILKSLAILHNADKFIDQEFKYKYLPNEDYNLSVVINFIYNIKTNYNIDYAVRGHRTVIFANESNLFKNNILKSFSVDLLNDFPQLEYNVLEELENSFEQYKGFIY